MADITPLTVFSSAGERNTDGLTQANGFPASQKPKRQWFNWLFNSLTAKINELVSKVNTLDRAVQPDATESEKGIVRLATEAETATGTSESLATHPKGVRDLVNAYRLLGGISNVDTLKIPIVREDTGGASSIALKYGEVFVASGTTITYPDGAFSNATHVVIACQTASSGTLHTVAVGNQTATGFVIWHSHSNPISIAYYSIGY